jgi:hypothetical protein
MRGRRTYLRLLCALLGATTLGLVGAAPANAVIGTMTANLRVFKADSPPGYYWVHVYGSISMTQAEAQGLINSGHKVVWRLIGDDPVFNDVQLGTRSAPIFVGPNGLHYSHAERVPRAVVNEDDSFTDHHDELFADPKLQTQTGQTIRSRDTNNVGGYF